MPFSHKCGLVTRLLKEFRKRLLLGVENASGVVKKPVGAGVFACNHTSSTRPAEAVGYEAICEPDAV